MQSHPSVFARACAAVFYGTASVAVIFINKIVLTNYKFPSFLFLAIGQLVATIVVLTIGRLFNLIQYPDFSLDIVKKIFPLPVFYGINLVTGLGSTKNLNLPMFTVLRRVSILMVMLGEWLILGLKPSRLVQVSVGLMVFGSLIAAINDLAFDLFGYALVMTNNFGTAANGIFVKKKLDSKDLGKWGLLYYNALFVFPFALLMAYFSGDLEKALSFSYWNSPIFFCLFIFACICGFILNYSIVLCTQYNTPLTTACVGPIKNVIVTYGGMFTSGDYIFSVPNFIGINISVVGSLIYTYVTFRSKPGATPSIEKSTVESDKVTLSAAEVLHKASNMK